MGAKLKSVEKEPRYSIIVELHGCTCICEIPAYSTGITERRRSQCLVCPLLDANMRGADHLVCSQRQRECTYARAEQLLGNTHTPMQFLRSHLRLVRGLKADTLTHRFQQGQWPWHPQLRHRRKRQMVD